MIRRPPRSTLFPYTTLFRSQLDRALVVALLVRRPCLLEHEVGEAGKQAQPFLGLAVGLLAQERGAGDLPLDRKSTRLNSSHANISYAVFCLKKKKIKYVRFT